jgi:AraC-like DNA-binding protein
MLINTYKNENFSHQSVDNRRKSTGVHFHNEHEIYYLLNGTTKYFIGDKIFHIESGNFVVIPKGVNHKTDSEDCLHNERILLSFDDTALGKNSKDSFACLCQKSVVYIPDSKREIVETILKKIEDEYATNDEYSHKLINLYIEELLLQMSRLCLDYKPNLSHTDKTMYAISKYIRQNFATDLSLLSLSKKFAISESHLSRSFRAVTNIGINEYITYVRLLNAERLLIETNFPITEIAGRCGFNDSNYFSTVFKKAKGITPLKFGHKHKEVLK